MSFCPKTYIPHHPRSPSPSPPPPPPPHSAYAPPIYHTHHYPSPLHISTTTLRTPPCHSFHSHHHRITTSPSPPHSFPVNVSNFSPVFYSHPPPPPPVVSVHHLPLPTTNTHLPPISLSYHSCIPFVQGDEKSAVVPSNNFHSHKDIPEEVNYHSRNPPHIQFVSSHSLQKFNCNSISHPDTVDSSSNICCSSKNCVNYNSAVHSCYPPLALYPYYFNNFNAPYNASNFPNNFNCNCKSGLSIVELEREEHRVEFSPRNFHSPPRIFPNFPTSPNSTFSTPPRHSFGIKRPCSHLSNSPKSTTSSPIKCTVDASYQRIHVQPIRGSRTKSLRTNAVELDNNNSHSFHSSNNKIIPSPKHSSASSQELVKFPTKLGKPSALVLARQVCLFLFS